MLNRLVIPAPPRSRAIATVPSGDNAIDSGDKAIERLIKYIPAEIISGYMLLAGLVDAASRSSPLRTPGAWLLVGLGVVLTPLYLWKAGRPTGVQWWHLPISTVSFLLWAYALGGPFESVKLFGFPYEKWFAAFLAGAFSWSVALIWKPTES